LPAAAVFGIVPPELLARLPFINSIGHVDDSVSPLLIIHLLLIAAFGLRSLWESAAQARAPKDALTAALLLALLAALFVGYTHAVMRPDVTDCSPVHFTASASKMP
ncbi:MAG: hypothetical protein ABI318_17975, partial [Chthoniobacteraceae bacterium]